MKKKILMTLALAVAMLAPMSVSAQSYGDVDGVTSATQQTSVQRHPRHRHFNRLTVDSLNTYMKANLSLTSEQETKVKALNEQYRDIIEGPRPPRDGQRPHFDGNKSGRPVGPPPQNAGDSTSRAERFAQFRAHINSRQESYDKELKAILNDSQYADYEKIKPQFASQRRPRQRPGKQ